MSEQRPTIDWKWHGGFHRGQVGQPQVQIEPAEALRHFQEGTAFFTPVAADAILGILADRKRLRSR